MFDHYLGIPYSHDMCPCHHCFPDKKPCHDSCRPDTVSCPLYRDNTIIQQPADLTTLTNTYTQEAVKFIKVKLLLTTRTGLWPWFLLSLVRPCSGLLSKIQSKLSNLKSWR